MESAGRALVIGTTDDRMLIDRVGAASEGFFGYSPAELLGQSILSLVDSATKPDLLDAFREAFSSRDGVTTVVGVRAKSGQVLPCEAVVVPLVPAPSSAFAFVQDGDGKLSASVTAQLLFVQGLRRVVWDPATAQARDVPAGISQLTTRELEIVRGVVSGDRVRSIANRLFLSESTVRSHLSSIYRKLAVRSHQELVDRLRAADLE